MYEAKSLGVYESDSEDDEINDDAHWDRPSESRVAIWGRYLMRHARRQLSFGMYSHSGSWRLVPVLTSLNRHVVASRLAVLALYH